MNYCNYHQKYDNCTGTKYQGQIENYFNVMNPVLSRIDKMNISFKDDQFTVNSGDFMRLSNLMKENVNVGTAVLDVNSIKRNF